LEEFLDKISPLKASNKLGAVLIQLPSSFTVREFKNTEEFLDRLPTVYGCAIEFRNPSWNTERRWEMLKHYNIAAVMTDSPEQDKLQFLSETLITANHSFIRCHGRHVKPRYNYLYSKEELKPWADKVRKISLQITVVGSFLATIIEIACCKLSNSKIVSHLFNRKGKSRIRTSLKLLFTKLKSIKTLRRYLSSDTYLINAESHLN
jgi:uncharacterized protein YecE (DUF72 family)